MTKICRESEASLDYYSLFKAIMKRAPVPMSPLESLASSAVRTAHKVGYLRCTLWQPTPPSHLVWPDGLGPIVSSEVLPQQPEKAAVAWADALKEFGAGDFATIMAI